MSKQAINLVWLKRDLHIKNILWQKQSEEAVIAEASIIRERLNRPQ